MKKILISSLFLIGHFYAHAQFGNLVKKLGQTAKSTAESKSDNKVSETISKGFDGIFKKKDRSGKTQSGNNPSTENTIVKNKDLKSYSRFDFVQGEKLVYAEDFSKDLIGEMPLNWTTNGKGELMELDGIAGKWLRGFKNSELTSINKNELGENYTIEFDMVYYFGAATPAYVMPDISIRMMNNYPKSMSGNPRKGENSFIFNVHPKPEKSLAWIDCYNDGPTFKSTNIEVPFFSGKYNQVQHYSIQVQKTRLRIWIDENKVIDMPQVIDTSKKMSRISFELGGASYPENEVGFYVSNIRFANGSSDTRHKLLEEGKFSTSGILFAINSAEIQPTSYGVLKEIGTVLKENPNVKIQIIGHTSSDGNSTTNLELSKKRAIAVKEALGKDFGIDDKRIETDGKGDTQPVSSNATSEGKTQNRRVEFLKL